MVKKTKKYAWCVDGRLIVPRHPKKITCSPGCSRIRKQQSHIGKKNQWTEESREQLKKMGQTGNLKMGAAAAKRSPKFGPFETNINAKNWHLISPDGKHYRFKSLNFWLRKNCLELFGVEPDSREFNNIRSGLTGAKRAAMGKKYLCCTYRGWQVVPTDDDL